MEMLRLRAERNQALHERFLGYQHEFLQPLPDECCSDCQRVQQRLAATCQAAAVWFQACSLRAIQQLEVVERGEPLPQLPLPPFELQLPKGVPHDMPPCIDRCSSCQNLLDHYLNKEQELQLLAAVHGKQP
ncbi:hypothetical protein ABPG77_010955 [Micractinium sp. CCAP 211/92]